MAINLNQTTDTQTPSTGTLNLTGILNFTSTNKITGDFSNATLANRVYIQSNSTNGGTNLGLLPNGSGNSSGYQVFNATTLTNTSYAAIDINGSNAFLRSNGIGLAAALPLIVEIGGSTQLTFTTSGPVTNNNTFYNGYDVGNSTSRNLIGTGIGNTTDVGNGTNTTRILGPVVTFPSIGTSASAANAFFNGSNNLLIGVSSNRYKTDIRNITLEQAYNVLNLRPILFKSLCKDDDPKQDFPGFIAEEAELIEPLLVVHRIIPEISELPIPDGFTYDRLPAYLLKIIQDLVKRIETLEAKG